MTLIVVEVEKNSNIATAKILSFKKITGKYILYLIVFLISINS